MKKRNISDLSEQALLEQLIEECGELTQACAKRLRIIRHENFTPVTLFNNRTNLKEEIADVELCLQAVKNKVSFDTSDVAEMKRERWNERLEMWND